MPEYRDEPRRLVQGQHDAIISESLFYTVQINLDGRKRIQFVKMTTDDSLPLRGYLLCPRCGKQLTGSASKGRHSYYYYYHYIISKCGTRYKAEEANNSFVGELQRFIPKDGVAELYLEGKLTGFSKPTYDIDGCVDKALNTLSCLNTTYLEADTTIKRDIIGSIYPEKLCFDGSAYRTRVNEAARLIYLINSKLGTNKIGQNLTFQACPIR